MKIVAVIPCYNEERTIGNVVRGAQQFCQEVIVVDDGSSDDSLAAARKVGARTISHVVTLGAGAALSTGLRASLLHSPDVVVTLDGDGQHSPTDIPDVLKPIVDGEADVVIGSRFIGDSSGMPLLKKIGNRILSKITSWVCGERITDSQCGFRGYSPKVIESVMHEAADYSWASELTILFVKKGFRVREVAVKTIYPRKRFRGTGVRDGIKIFYETLKSK